MDEPRCTTLMDAIKDVPDPRRARGKRYAWSFLLTPVAAGVASGQQTGHAIAHWVTIHAHELIAELHPPGGRVLSESTLRRVLRTVNIQALEERLGRYMEQLATEMTAAVPRWVRCGRGKPSMVKNCGAYDAMVSRFTW